ncbi:MAG: DNA topology modulation protein [Lachnospiraceae bacterium]|nr:DNA topology modulation protein [Lachnospiraceae bacterium]
MKIAVIGYSGSGKSTLAKALAEKIHSSVLYLDRVHWLPGWIEQEPEEEIRLVKQFLDSHESWVIDGNYSKLAHERRMQEADKIIFLNFNRFSCLYRAIKRNYHYKGKCRESITNGCDEKIDLEFAWWILHAGRNKEHKEKFQRILTKYPDKVLVIKNQKQLDQFYRKLLK